MKLWVTIELREGKCHVHLLTFSAPLWNPRYGCFWWSLDIIKPPLWMLSIITSPPQQTRLDGGCNKVMAQGIDHRRQHKWIISYYSIFQSFCIRLRLGTLRSYSRPSWTGMGGSLKTSLLGLPMFTIIIFYNIHVNADMVKMFISLSCVKYIWPDYHYRNIIKFRSRTIINDIYSQTGPC